MENLAHDCFSLISLDSIIKTNDMYYPQVYLEVCNYRIKKNKNKNWLNKTFASDLSDNEPDSGTDTEPDSDADYN